MRGYLSYQLIFFSFLLPFLWDNTNSISVSNSISISEKSYGSSVENLEKQNSGDGLLVINEFDYDQGFPDTSEFIELKNISSDPVDLSNYRLELIDGSFGVVYLSFPLSGLLASGDYFVVCANNATVSNCDLDVSPDINLIQDGAPDGIRIMNINTGIIEDGVGYEGNTIFATEQSSVALIDNFSFLSFSLSRLPDGSDTDINDVDFVYQCATPGNENIDSDPPVISCPPNQTITITGNCNTFLQDYTLLATVQDNCPGSLTLTQSPSPNSFLFPGEYTITITADDGATMPVSCSFNLIIQDVSAPEISACPQTISLTDQNGTCNENYSFSESDLTGEFSPADWTWNPNGSVTADFSFDGISSVSVVGSDDNGNGCLPPVFQSVVLSTQVQTTGILTFDWTYETFDLTPFFDPFGYALNGSFFQLTDGFGPDSQSGSFSLQLNPGDVFSLVVLSLDECSGAAVGSMFNFQFYPGFEISENCPGLFNLTGTRDDGLTLQDPYPVCNTNISWVVTDEAGNVSTSSCTSSVKVTESENPIASCESSVVDVFLNSLGVGVINSTMLDNGSTDNCGALEFTLLDPNGFGITFDCNDIPTGQMGFALQVADCSGNTSTCQASIQVSDNMPPTWDQSQGSLDAQFTCSSDVDDYVAGLLATSGPNASDNSMVCFTPTINIISDNTTGNFPCSYTRIITYRATDNYSNSTGSDPSFPDFTVTIDMEDNEAPSFVETPGALDVVLSCSDSSAIAAAEILMPTIVDNCLSSGQATLVTVRDSISINPACPNAYLRLLDYVAIDGCGNQSLDTFTVRIETFDNEGPVFLLPPGALNATLACDDNVGLQNILATIPEVTDNCSPVNENMVSLISDNMIPGPVCDFTFRRVLVYQATDGCGNISSDNYVVTIDVFDTENPIILTPPSDLSIECAGSSNTEIQFTDWLNSYAGLVASDNCGSLEIIMTDDAGINIPLPSQTPGFDVAAYLNASLIQCNLTGSITVTFLVEDDCLNSETLSATFTISDTQAPTFSNPPSDVTVPCDGTSDPGGAFSNWVATFAGALAIDNCGNFTLAFDPPNPQSPDFCGGGVTVDIVASDPCGNETRLPATFNIIDTEPPVISSGPSNLTVECDGSGNTIDFSNWLASGGGAMATDNCGDISWITNPASPTIVSDCGSTGQITVEFIAIDICGEATSAGSGTFRIADSDPPNIDQQAQDTSIECDGSGLGNQILTWLNSRGGAMASDQCSSISWTNNFDAGNFVAACGSTGSVAVTFYASDACTLIDSTSAVFSLTDITAPTLQIPADISTSADPGICCVDLENSQLIATVSDACDVNPIFEHSYDQVNWMSGGDASAGPDASGCFQTGITIVYFRATDNCSNAILDSMSVTVQDDELPQLNCPGDIVLNTEGTPPSGTCMNSAGWQTPVSTDNCSTVNLVGPISSDTTTVFDIDPATGFVTAEFPIGPTTITYVATDVIGNTSTCSFTVTINDTESPIINSCPQNIVYQLDADCQPLFQNVPDFTALVDAADNCGLILSQLPTPGGLISSLPGITPLPGESFGVTISVLDLNGNPAVGGNGPAGDECIFTVIYADTIPPQIACPQPIDVPVFTDDCFAANIPDLTLLADISDNCAANIQIVQSPLPGLVTTAPDETIIITFTVADGFGNSNSCSFDINIVDDAPPVLMGCVSSINTQVNAGACIATVTLTPPSVFDNCGISIPITGVRDDGMALTDPYFVGTTIVSWSVTDNYGNTSSCQTQVNVSDVDPPSALCSSPFNASLNNFGQVEICALSFDAGSFGICNNQVTLQIQRTGVPLPPEDCLIFSCADVSASPLSVTLFVTDVSGNTALCNSAVTIQDNFIPLISFCPPDQSGIDNDHGTCSALVSVPPIVYSDNCSASAEYSTNAGLSWTMGADASGEYAVGVTNISWRVTDIEGNSTTCETIIEVIDSENPDFPAAGAPSGCPTTMVVQNDPGFCTAVVIYDLPVGIDNCPGANTILVSGQGSGINFPFGTSTEVYVVTDVAGNTATCSFDISVQDTESPSAICQDVSIQLDALGQASVTPNNIDNGSADNCDPIPTIELDREDFSCLDLGVNTVIMTVTDASGNSATCAASVTVADNEAPTFTCGNSPFNRVTSEDLINGCFYQASNSEFDPFSAGDNCTANVSHDLLTAPMTNTLDGAQFPVGSTSVIWTISDNAGNSGSCSINIVVTDDELPVCSGPPQVFINLSQANPTSCGAFANMTAATAIDNCGIAFIVNSSSFADNNGADASGSYPLGTTNFIWGTMDVNGNFSTCPGSVTVIDDVSPIISCPETLTIPNDAGVCGAFVSLFEAFASDNCVLNRIEYVITHSDGSTTSGTSQGTPTLNTVNASGFYPVGTNSVLFVTYDIFGNSESCVSAVVVTEEEVPVLTCLIDPVFNSSDDGLPGDCRYLPSGSELDPIGAFDNCSSVTISHDYSIGGSTLAGLPIPVGQTIVIWTATDGSGNSSTCASTVTIIDDELPTMECAASGIRNTGDDGITDDCFYTVQGTEFDLLSFEDNCDIESIDHNFNGGGSTLDGSNIPVGITPIVWLITDVNGNTETCQVEISVIDDAPPELICPVDAQRGTSEDNLSLYDCYYTVQGPEFDPVFSQDNCGIASISHDYPEAPFAGTLAGSNLPVGQTVITWLISDANGTMTTCDVLISVGDDENPVASCSNLNTFSLGESGLLTLPQAAIDNTINLGSFDNCQDSLTFTVSQSTFDCNDVGINPITLTATDGGENTSQCFTRIEIQDNTSPDCIAQNNNVFLDQMGNGSISVNEIDGGSTDACGINNMNINISNFDCGDVGQNAVVLTVTDTNGNTSSCTSTVTVVDQISPLAQCNNLTVQLDASGAAGISASMINGGSTDACGVSFSQLNVSTFTCVNVGVNNVILTVSDVNGNSSTCNSQVIVEDNVAPVALCQNISVALDASGNTTISAADINGGSGDACGIASMLVEPSQFDCSDVGPNQVILNVADSNGNSAACSSIVTISEIGIPVATCQNITAYLDSQGTVTISANDIDNGSLDPCGISASSISQSDFDCAETGPNNVILTVTDNNGNSSTCSSIVTVLDTVAPIAQCIDLAIELDVNGTWSLEAQDLNGGSTDNCAISQYDINLQNFNCFNVGQNEVILTVTDFHGNSGTCSSLVEIQDLIAPVANCIDFTLFLDSNGDGSLSANDIDAGSTDACGIQNLSVFPNFFDCEALGITVVTLTVSDGSGNTSTCSTEVMVVDNLGPTVNCSSTSVFVNSGGSVSVTFADINTVATDACGIGSFLITDALTGNPANYSCSDVGTTQDVIVTVTDINGNSSSCSALVDILDTINPSAVCVPALTLALNNVGSGTLLASDVNNGSSDNCGFLQASLNQTLFDCSHIGMNTVDLVVTDDSGNQNICSTEVTVVDATPPVMLCQNASISIGPNGDVSISVSDLNLGSSDECCLDTIIASQTYFNLPGIYPVTLSATDCSGNISTCSVNVTVNPSTTVNFCPTVILQGSFNPATTGPSNRMRRTLGIAGLIPTVQPYNISPWFYSGAESFPSIISIPNDMVDWVLVVIRDGSDPSVVLGRVAGVLHTSGEVTDISGNNLALTVSAVSGYYIEVIHRNHLPVNSNVPLLPDASGVICHDFTSDMTQAYRNTALNDDPMEEIPSFNGIFYGMVSGNAQSIDCQVDANDISFLFQNYNTSNVYGDEDINMDGIVDANDVNLLFGNYNRNCHSPY